MMEKQIIKRINGIDIFTVKSDSGEIIVPIKPICIAIGIGFAAQHVKIQNDEILSSTISLSETVGGDGKDREMVCLPLRYVFGWLFTINPKNVDPKAKDVVIEYKKQCFDALYDHFARPNTKLVDSVQRENEILKEINTKLDLRKNLNFQVKEIDAEVKNLNMILDKVREERSNPQPSLFD